MRVEAHTELVKHPESPKRVKLNVIKGKCKCPCVSTSMNPHRCKRECDHLLIQDLTEAERRVLLGLYSSEHLYTKLSNVLEYPEY